MASLANALLIAALSRSYFSGENRTFWLTASPVGGLATKTPMALSFASVSDRATSSESRPFAAFR
jgi:hypothetical protein